MTARIKKLYDEIVCCQVFADIGCDHGYVAKAVLDGNKCDKVIISDISEKCLKKAEDLLSDYVKSGRAESKVSDGFEKIEYCDQALVAGMGGEEICGIISRAKSLPERLIIQPMKNTRKVRELLLEKGYCIQKDFVFYVGRKYYDLIVATTGRDKYLEEELDFGRTNLQEKSKDFIRRLTEEKDKLLGYVNSGNLSDKDVENMKREIEKIERYL